MDVSRKMAVFLLTICLVALPATADEIQLKDGKSFSGTIVAFDNNMFKVKTDFGYILIEKSKIATIIPTGSDSGKTEAKATTKKPVRADATKSDTSTSASDSTGVAPASSAVAAVEKTPIFSNTAVKPEIPAITTTKAVAPAIKSSQAATSTTLATPAATLARPQEGATPAIPEEVAGNLYTNHAYGFRMYKAPSWQLIDDARTLPNAIVAMGTFNESTLMVVGREKTHQGLDAAAVTVEKRLHEVYENYHQTSQQNTTVGGLPAVEFHYRGTADGHDWSGTLAVMARGSDIFTVLGMTYADTDLIQIQENVIAKAIASLDFSTR
jgi:hypothetical protein